MSKKGLPIIVIIASSLLVIVNVATTDEFDNGFWMQSLSSILIIIAMLFTLKSRTNRKQD
ncbi:hypothetical protein [Psychroserpens sp.]|jgi:hypothetical protein|uniref:hypothetical protein n=1 Tax=Psychroserpens sp. TaxID=2020870 RepID=UPI0039E4B8C2